MPSPTFEIRECQNPDCRLRYPVIEIPSVGLRCPRCLGETLAVLRRDVPAPRARESAPKTRSVKLEALLDNVRSALNVGSMFRTAEGLGLDHLYLAGITPTPEETEVQKTALGAASSVKWSQHKNGLELAVTLKHRGHPIWVLETTPGALPITFDEQRQRVAPPPVLIVGNEVTGVDPAILEIADRTFCIPMRGSKTSFNVAVAFALAVYSLTALEPVAPKRSR